LFPLTLPTSKRVLGQPDAAHHLIFQHSCKMGDTYSWSPDQETREVKLLVHGHMSNGSRTWILTCLSPNGRLTQLYLTVFYFLAKWGFKRYGPCKFLCSLSSTLPDTDTSVSWWCQEESCRKDMPPFLSSPTLFTVWQRNVKWVEWMNF
jgi:hypothetical protein